MSVPDLQTKSQHYKNFASLNRLNRLAGKLYRSNPVNKKTLVIDISSDDVHQLLRNLNRYNVRYLLVGGMAGVVYGHIRTTQDMDLWIKNAPDNTKALVEALSQSEVPGAALLERMPSTFGWTSVRFGLSSFELDLGHSLKRPFRLLIFLI